MLNIVHSNISQVCHSVLFAMSPNILSSSLLVGFHKTILYRYGLMYTAPISPGRITFPWAWRKLLTNTSFHTAFQRSRLIQHLRPAQLSRVLSTNRIAICNRSTICQIGCHSGIKFRSVFSPKPRVHFVFLRVPLCAGDMIII